MTAAPQARPRGKWGSALALAAVALLVLAAPALGSGRGIGHYAQDNLVSNVPDAAELLDESLVNAWGLAFSPTSPAWVADNGTDVSTLYSGANGTTAIAKNPLTVSIPAGGAPTGAVFNGSAGFAFGTAPARFLFSSETGVISGWNGGLAAQIGATVDGAIFKGLAIATTATGPRIYASDFHNGAVDVWDANWNPVQIPGAFTDPGLPAGYAPFGIQTVAGNVGVTYAEQDADAEDELAGPGKGFVDVYDTDGSLLRRVASRGELDAPWGIALAPAGFGKASGALLIGNFGDGRILAYDPHSGKFLGALRNEAGARIAIDGLWALEFGNGTIGTPQTLLFTAGPDDESNGLFGALTPFSDDEE